MGEGLGERAGGAWGEGEGGRGVYAAEKLDLMESSLSCRCFPMSHCSSRVRRSMLIL